MTHMDEEGKRQFRIYMANYRATHPDYCKRNDDQSHARIKTLRKLIIEHYGGKCACCGESHFEFMVIDHIKGGGTKIRKSMGNIREYFEIVKQGFPPDRQILCANCNQAKKKGMQFCPIHHPELYV